MSKRKKKPNGPDHGKQNAPQRSPVVEFVSKHVTRHITRRRALITAGLSLVGAGTYFGWDPAREAITGEPTRFRRTRNIMDEHGTVVLDETNGAQGRLSANDKQWHGGQGFAQVCADQPALFSEFLAHHDGIVESNKQVLEADGNTRFLLEGFPGPSERWPRDMVQFLNDVTQMEELLRARPDQAKRGLLSAIANAPAQGAQILNSVSASYRTAAYLKQRNLLHLAHGLDIPGMEALTQIFHRRLDQLVAIPEPTDAQCQEFIRDVRGAQAQDMQRRHRYYVDTFNQMVQPGMIGKGLLGSSHFRSGDLLEQPIANPLEDSVLALPDTRLIVSDPHGLANLQQRRTQANVLVVGTESLTLETVRRMHRELRARRQGAGMGGMNIRDVATAWADTQEPFATDPKQFAQFVEELRKDVLLSA